MDIESKRYRVRVIGWNVAEVLNKATGQVRHVKADSLPGVSALAMMHENQFDKAMEGAENV